MMSLTCPILAPNEIKIKSKILIKVQKVLANTKNMYIIAVLNNLRRLAQLVEQRTPNPQVGGSSPSSPAIFLHSPFFNHHFLILRKSLA